VPEISFSRGSWSYLKYARTGTKLSSQIRINKGVVKGQNRKAAPYRYPGFRPVMSLIAFCSTALRVSSCFGR